MPWDMRRQQRQGEPPSKFSKVITAVEIVRPTFDAGWWSAMVSRRAAMVHMKQIGFDVHSVAEPVEVKHVPRMAPREAPDAHPRKPRPQAQERSDAWALECWRAWDFERGPLHDVPLSIPYDVLRAPLTETPPKRRPSLNVAVVLTMTGWGDLERRAVTAAAEAVEALGKTSRLIVVQNGPLTDDECEECVEHVGTCGAEYVETENRGFAAACNSGLEHIPRSCRWVLFTQPDAVWAADTVKQAVVLAETYGTNVRPAVVGPSGGYILDAGTGHVSEYGRNIGDDGDPTAADFVAGYWLLAQAAGVRAVGGWSNTFYLYMEDPDLCCRLAHRGHRCVVAPSLCVDHVRGATIKARLSAHDIATIQRQSRETFAALWR